MMHVAHRPVVAFMLAGGGQRGQQHQLLDPGPGCLGQEPVHPAEGGEHERLAHARERARRKLAAGEVPADHLHGGGKAG
jgi:hypothetical protein